MSARILQNIASARSRGHAIGAENREFSVVYITDEGGFEVNLFFDHIDAAALVANAINAALALSAVAEAAE